ncbi:MAG: RDD family protein [Methanoregula sp. PtaU1.Bin051]|nr:MAG: RDD family protein [Methanoregula sp. PtaU1.Bin051]
MERTYNGNGSGLPEPVPANTLYLAKWSARFWAWLIDFILILLFLNIVIGALNWAWPISHLWELNKLDPFELGFQTFFFYVYWTLAEGYKGQSIGKMVMNLKVVNRDGSRLKYETAAIESLGKAFLPVLVLDCLIGWLAMPGTKLRLFNRISNTIVIKTDYREPDGVVYIKEKE